MNIELPEEIKFIFNKLQAAGFEGFIVGGCVRDILLKKSPKDWDICTNAVPQQVMTVFSGVCSVIPTGIKHGTVTLIVNNHHFETTTYRIDGLYSDNRRPDSVIYTSSLIEDLSRRDFTINAMAYNKCKGLFDPFKGINGINDKCIHCVGNADDRIREDYLRALRAVRFACQLGFKIDDSTIQAIVANKELINQISWERIRDEMCKILGSQRPDTGILLLKEMGLLQHIIPELEHYIITESNYGVSFKDPFQNILTVLNNAPDNLVVRLSLLLYFCSAGNDDSTTAERVLRKLRFSSSTINRIRILINESTCLHDITDTDIKKLMVKMGLDSLDNLFEYRAALLKSGIETGERLDDIIKSKEKCEKILEENQPLSVKDLKVNGQDLIGIGFNQGEEVGHILKILLDLVLENPGLNKKEDLMDIAGKQLRKK